MRRLQNKRNEIIYYPGVQGNRKFFKPIEIIRIYVLQKVLNLLNICPGEDIDRFVIWKIQRKQR